MKKDIEAIYPLTPMQLGMLFHALHAPASGMYVQQLQGTLRGELDLDVFRAAWTRVVERHAVLRTAFVSENIDEPRQVVGVRATMPTQVEDLCDLPDEGQRQRVLAFLEEDRYRGFRMSRAPLMRMTLFRNGDDTHHFVWTHHHIIVDGWSVALLLREVFALYAALVRGIEPQLPDSRPFSDYIAWLSRRDHASARTYWTRLLDGFVEPVPLPGGPGDANPEAGADATAGVARIELELDEAETTRLQHCAREHRLTLNTFVQGAWALVLSRHCRTDDIVYGTVTAGRPADIASVDGIVGLFVNTLPLRVRIGLDTPVADWLRTLQDHQSEQRQYEFSALADIRRASVLPAGVPLFDHVLAFENYPVQATHEGSGGPRLELVDVVSSERTNYPLTIQVFAGSRFRLRFLYETRCFQAHAIAAKLEHLRNALVAMAAALNTPLRGIDLSTAADRQRILRDWNDTAILGPQASTLDALIDAALLREPETVAVESEDHALTRERLRLDANRLARRLRRMGVGPDVLVGVCMERSTELMVALLAILKAGGAYVPLDPDFPPERVQYMREDSAVGLVLTQTHVLARFDPADTAGWIAIDRDGSSFADEPATVPEVLHRADDLAYVIYTSGSTGRPKGAMNSHRGICNRLLWMREHYAVDTTDCILQKTPLSFDVSVWELFLPLLSGARLAMARPRGHQDAAYVADAIGRFGVTVLHFVPSMLAMFLEEPGLERRCTGLRRVICSGETLPWTTCQAFFRRISARLENLYGPTEAAVDVSSWDCGRPDWAPLVPIGSPVANTRLLVLDPELALVPPGMTGELFIGGVQVGRGYWRRPSLTAERFLPDPFADAPGQRLYRTGDLARWLPDGNIEYAGRVDDQVKIGGVRIEPGEIEYQIERHAQVRQAVVKVFQPANGGKQLVAHVVPEIAENDAADAAAIEHALPETLRAFLRERLPTWLVPAHILVTRQLPLSPSGKVDRRRLPDPADAEHELSTLHIEPRTGHEKALANIWGDVLGVERVGIADNFFALGGDSIRAIRIQSRARREGLVFPLQALFATPNIADLLQSLEGGGIADDIAGLPTPAYALISEVDRALLPEAIEDAFPLTRMQAGMLFHSELDPHSNLYHDVFTSHLRTPLEVDALRAAVAELVARHPVLRTAFDLQGFSQPLQLVYREADVTFGYDDWRMLEAGERQRRFEAWLVEEKRSRYDWSRPGLLRFHVHARDDASFQLTVGFHHSVLDGWSVAVMLTELFQLYVARRDQADAAAVAPPPRSGMADLVALEARALASDEARRFWTEGLDGRSATRLVHDAGTRRAPRIRVHPVALPDELSAKLIALARQLRVPPKSVLLAAHLRALAAATGETALLTGLVGSSRPETVDSDRSLGLYLNNLPFVFDLRSGSWSELVQQVFRDEQRLLPHRRFPLAEMHRLIGRGALFEVAFNYVHFHAYKAVQDSRAVDYLDGEFTQQTDLALLVNGFLDLGGSRLRISLDYDEGRISAAQVERLGSLYRRVLERMTADPSAPHERAGLLDDAEVARIDQSNATQSAQDEDDLDTRLRAQVARTPDALALVSGGERLSYAELDAQVESLAARLRADGVSAEERVGVCLARGPSLVVALLAVVRAGAAYVPLDPAYPADRIAYALEDAQARRVLTTNDLAPALSGAQARLCCVDAPEWPASADAGARAPVVASPDHLAYVIYTSGSTGRPKGVMVTHRTLVNFLDTMRDRPGLTASDVLLAVTTVSFDIAGLELYLPLTTGACVVLASGEEATDPERLSGLLEAAGATVMQATPATWRMLLASGWRGKRDLKVLCGGEAFPADLAQALVSVCGEVWNLYGPTETTIWSARHAVSAGSTRSTVPIGDPIANTRLYVLDPWQQPLPEGAVGELYIGGVGLARGYLGRAGLTAERFVPDPYGWGAGARMYRTGDQVRRGADGTLEFLGRLDHQVKLRGFRIELGEIEHVLSGAPGVQEVFAGLLTDGVGEPVLACGVDGATLEIDALRQHAMARLPEYMVPSRFIFVTSLPRQPNGKLDRRAALSLLGEARVSRPASHAPPVTAAERLVVTIWGQVLGVDAIGVDSDFFELGGHSLSAIQLVARLRDVFQVELPLAGLFQSPTVAGVVAAIEKAWGSAETVDTIAATVLEVNALPEAEVERMLSL